MVTAVVVAGGRSTRFEGGDKAVADLAGTPMIRRVVDRLAGVVDGVVVNCRAEQTPHVGDALEGVEPPVTYAEDPEPDRGPVAGIRTGLRAADDEYAVVVACDMPFVDPALVEHLLERAAGHDAAVPRTADGWYQTTQAVYRAGAMAEACDAALARGERKVLAPLSDLDVVEVDPDEVRAVASPDTFENVNTREELQAAAERLRE